MSKLLNRSLRQFMIYAALLLIISIPVYSFLISRLWQYELDEHKVVLSQADNVEDNYVIVKNITQVTVIFFALMMGGFILLNRRISKRLWQPFYSSLDKIKSFKLDQHQKITFGNTDISEFADLNERLETLIAGSVAAYSQQKEFAENASHELQTPLAVVQSKLELLMQTSSLTNDQYAIIEDALKALNRVSRINKNLLLLTKIENSQFMDEEEINISSLLQTNMRHFENFKDEKQLEIREEIPPNIEVSGNRVLIEMLVNNLLINAIRYSPNKGAISILLTPQCLQVKNPGTSTLNVDQIFKRFGSGSMESPGTGLGLALVKQISARYKWEVSYSFQSNQHAFTVVFR